MSHTSNGFSFSSTSSGRKLGGLGISLHGDGCMGQRTSGGCLVGFHLRNVSANVGGESKRLVPRWWPAAGFISLDSGGYYTRLGNLVSS